MNITGKITGIKYKILLSEDLPKIDLSTLNINLSPSYFLVEDNKHTFAVSKWVSPKRTRSYPYERVYNTLNLSKKITIIPIIKDEGKDGDRDFLQWDTVSLMSLLDVFVIFEKTKSSYANIAQQAGVELHNFRGIESFKEKIGNDVEQFMQFSREKAEKAQSREIVTTQPKENLSTLTKAKITITNYLGGQYFFTVDEALLEKFVNKVA